ncbi:MAG: magnesium chelatase [Saprospiraceae bacterium]|nr:magnesium chelatase [Saprospiraceae bacterium]
MKEWTQIRTLGALKKSDYRPMGIREEMRKNLIEKIQNKEEVFSGIYGYENTVIPQMERAILSGHHINFLGLRGQAKTRMARMMVGLLDEWMPIVEGSEINDDPFLPLSKYARDLIAEKGDETPIQWIHSSSRYTEKLATPDVSISDLIGDLDPIKASRLKASYGEEEALHFGLIPRSHRGIFVINELPDLAPRIQVSLFNILQEGDIQIRGFKFRFPFDIYFVFTANPEDYTSRGAIITPLKDRIQSQIFTHYPENIQTAKMITRQEVKMKDSSFQVEIPEIIEDLIEQIAVEARTSDYVDEKSGVSARLPISAYESIHSAVVQRLLRNGSKSGSARISDLYAAIPAIVGKVELVYEGEQEGAVFVAIKLIGEAIKNISSQFFKDIDLLKRKTNNEHKKKYQDIVQWFENGGSVELEPYTSDQDYKKSLEKVKGFEGLFTKAGKQELLLKELLLHALSEYQLIERKLEGGHLLFQDQLYSALKDITRN